MTRYRVPAIVNVIRRAGDDLYLGTSDGLYILRNEALTRVAFVLDASGRYSVRAESP